MPRKLTLLAVAVGGLAALVMPNAASAQQITDNSTPVPAGATVLETGTIEITTSSGTVHCKKVVFHMIVFSNGPLQSSMSGGGTATECKITQNGAPVVVTSIEIEEATREGGGEGAMTLALVTDIAGVLTCTFSGTVPISYTSGTSSSHIQGGLAGAGAGCASSAEIHGDLTSETADTTPVIVH